MSEARRATLALAALVALAAAAVALLGYQLTHLALPHLGTIAWYCRLPGATPGLAQSGTFPLPAWLSLGFLGAGVAFALARLARTVTHARRIGRLLASAPGASGTSAAAVRIAARAAGARLSIVPVVPDLGDRPAAFTVGFLRPRVAISASVVGALTDAELDAILLHETAHARRRDPLRLALAGFCRDLLFFLPISHALFSLVRKAQECAADDVAAEAAGPLEVASALIAFLRVAGRRPGPVLVPAAAGADPEARIRRLLGAPVTGRSRRGWLTQAGSTLLVSATLLTSVTATPAGATATALAGCCALTTGARLAMMAC